MLGHLGLARVEMEVARAGDIVCVTGVDDINISDTLCARDCPEALPPLTVDEPTVSMMFCVNTSPLAGIEGKFLTSRQIRERLLREASHNVALRVEETGDPDQFRVSGRGELHLAILIETMRREGYELAVSRPRVITKEENGKMLEPFEELTLDIEEAAPGQGHGDDGRAPRRTPRHAARRTWSGAAQLSNRVARLDGFPAAVPVDDVRHRDHVVRLRRLRRGNRGADRAAQRAAC